MPKASQLFFHVFKWYSSAAWPVWLVWLAQHDLYGREGAVLSQHGKFCGEIIVIWNQVRLCNFHFCSSYVLAWVNIHVCTSMYFCFPLPVIPRRVSPKTKRILNIQHLTLYRTETLRENRRRRMLRCPRKQRMVVVLRTQDMIDQRPAGRGLTWGGRKR